jgi:hypothetical protein
MTRHRHRGFWRNFRRKSYGVHYNYGTSKIGHKTHENGLVKQRATQRSLTTPCHLEKPVIDQQATCTNITSTMATPMQGFLANLCTEYSFKNEKEVTIVNDSALLSTRQIDLQLSVRSQSGRTVVSRVWTL